MTGERKEKNLLIISELPRRFRDIWLMEEASKTYLPPRPATRRIIFNVLTVAEGELELSYRPVTNVSYSQVLRGGRR